MELKPRVFIGSSSEGLKVAEYIKDYLKNDFECVLWTDDVFQYNESVFETLLKSASLFDFGIMIATKDDFTEVRGESFDVPRDNVVFEYGLFLGRMGAGHAFVIQEEGAKLPTDLFGITTPRFSITPDLHDAEKLNSELKRISKTMQEKVQIGELGLLPSTALAIGYFDFISLTCESLFTLDRLIVDGKEFKDFEFNVVLPMDLDGDVKKRLRVFCSKHKLKQIDIKAPGRNYPIWVSYEEDKDTLRIFDMPTTLNGIDKAIELYMRKGHIGKTTEQKMLELRELRNFKRVIQLLVADDPYCKKTVRIIEEVMDK